MEEKNYDVFSRNVSWCSINRTDCGRCAVYNRSCRCYISNKHFRYERSCISFIRLLVTPGDSIIFIHNNNSILFKHNNLRTESKEHRIISNPMLFSSWSYFFIQWHIHHQKRPNHPCQLISAWKIQVMVPDTQTFLTYLFLMIS